MNRTPLRYPGGKGKITNLIKEIIANTERSSGKCITRYVEPFAGGAGVAINLLIDGTVSEIVINDYDLGIYSFWKAVLTETERLVIDIQNSALTIAEWNRQKRILIDHKGSEYSYELGFATFYLNRTNRSGILKAGPIGGKSQTGKWKLDARFNKKELINRILSIAKFKDKITVLNIDVIESFDILSNHINETSFIYFDPPYVEKGSDLYMNFLHAEDHEKLFRNITTLKHIPWIITYDVSDYIADLYSDYNQGYLGINYCLYSKKKANELIIYSNKSLIS